MFETVARGMVKSTSQRGRNVSGIRSKEDNSNRHLKRFLLTPPVIHTLVGETYTLRGFSRVVEVFSTRENDIRARILLHQWPLQLSLARLIAQLLVNGLSSS